MAHGNCSVPYDWAEDKQLGSWVSKQRTLKHKLDRGEPSQGMTAERAARLDALGFAWDRAWGSTSRSGDVGWEARLAQLTAYKAAHGDCSSVSQRCGPRTRGWATGSTPSGRARGSWTAASPARG